MNTRNGCSKEPHNFFFLANAIQKLSNEIPRNSRPQWKTNWMYTFSNVQIKTNKKPPTQLPQKTLKYPSDTFCCTVQNGRAPKGKSKTSCFNKCLKTMHQQTEKCWFLSIQINIFRLSISQKKKSYFLIIRLVASSKIPNESFLE